MEDRRTSCLNAAALTLTLLVVLTYPVWKLDPDERRERKVDRPKVSRPTTFQYASASRGTEQDFARGQAQPSRELVRRQLDRHARNLQRGFYTRMVDNPNVPEEMRSRFSQERERLKALAEEYPDIMAHAEQALVPAALNPDGSFTPEFAEVVKSMELYGDWDSMVENYVDQLMQAAQDPDLPESRRPTMEDIQQARDRRMIPTL